MIKLTYEQQLKILLTLDNNEKLREKWNKKMQYILIDYLEKVQYGFSVTNKDGMIVLFEELSKVKYSDSDNDKYNVLLCMLAYCDALSAIAPDILPELEKISES